MLDPNAANSWYYTLSAVPQTLGAVITLAATFVVFRLPDINARIESNVTYMQRMMMTFDQFFKLDEISKLGTPELVEKYRAGVAVFAKEMAPKSWTPYVTRVMTQLEIEYTGMAAARFYERSLDNSLWMMNDKVDHVEKLTLRRKKIIEDLKYSSAWSIATLIASMVLLPFYNVFGGLAWVVELLIVASAAMATILSVQMVKEIAST